LNLSKTSVIENFWPLMDQSLGFTTQSLGFTITAYPTIRIEIWSTST